VKTQSRYLVSLNPDGRQFLHEFMDYQVRECSLVVEPSFGGFKPRIAFHIHRAMTIDGLSVEHVQHLLWCDEDPDPTIIPMIIALAAGELRGRYESDTAHALFWSGMVMKAGGLKALATIDRYHAEFYAVRGWEGAPCPTCRRVQPMRTERLDGEILTRRCTVCSCAWSISREALLEAVIAQGAAIPCGSDVSK